MLSSMLEVFRYGRIRVIIQIDGRPMACHSYPQLTCTVCLSDINSVPQGAADQINDTGTGLAGVVASDLVLPRGVVVNRCSINNDITGFTVRRVCGEYVPVCTSCWLMDLLWVTGFVCTRRSLKLRDRLKETEDKPKMDRSRGLDCSMGKSLINRSFKSGRDAFHVTTRGVRSSLLAGSRFRSRASCLETEHA